LTSFSISATRVFDLGLGHAVLLEAEGDVLLDRHMRKQRIGLEHHVDRPLVGRHAGHVLPVDQMRARGRLSKPASMRSSVDLPQPEPPSSAEELALVDVERQVVDRCEVTELLGDIAKRARTAWRPDRRYFSASGIHRSANRIDVATPQSLSLDINFGIENHVPAVDRSPAERFLDPSWRL
jgi:hypothetical protein